MYAHYMTGMSTGMYAHYMALELNTHLFKKTFETGKSEHQLDI